MTAAQRTPGMWQVTPDGVRIQTADDAPDYQIADCDDSHFAPDYSVCKANAAYIVLACNAHDALVHALALVIESYEAGDGAMATKQVIDHVRSILATQRVTP